YLIVHDSGRALDAEAVRRQILGGVVQGLGGSLLERLVYDETGQLLTASLMDYAVPRAEQVPPVEIVAVESPSPLNPLGLKGAGEGGCMGAYAVLASAVEDALSPSGFQVESLPIDSQQIWRLLGRRAAVVR
ncbi:MAG: molybdopterin cofactor-binding domain-containing protein, partial [Anaerolineales bacterium]